jgi:hypothetical protein
LGNVVDVIIDRLRLVGLPNIELYEGEEAYPPLPRIKLTDSIPR